jgi:hypothetical protein
MQRLPSKLGLANAATARRPWLLFALLVSLAALWPAAAGAETRTFVNLDELFPSEGTVGGPAPKFPSAITVSGVPGTVTAVRVTTAPLDSASPDDIDMALTGPNGQTVALMSDACGEYPNGFKGQYFTFDDAAPTFLSNNGPCPSFQKASYLPSNYLGGAPEPEDFSANGGPEGPFGNKLAALAGGSPNGDWKLWVLDDDSLGYNGFTMRAWVLTLEVTPPPPPPPTIVTVQVPVPTPAATSAPTPPPTSAPTGKRAQAMAKCKSKPNQQAKKRCRSNARKLPV